MNKPKKSQRMTLSEKQIRKKARERLRADGLLPPKKKPLNRKKFIAQAREVLDKEAGYEFNHYIYWALAEMLGKREMNFPKGISCSPEAVGAAKVILMAAKRREFEMERQKESPGDWTYKVKDLLEAVMPIYEA